MNEYAPPLGFGGDPNVFGRELLNIIADSIDNAPRSAQRRIGPSELGTPCTFCLAHKLAELPEQRPTGGASPGYDDWLPFIGTSVHAQLDGVFEEDDAAADLRAIQNGNASGAPARWRRENKLNVGVVNGVDIVGSCDLYDVLTGIVVDWKIVGATTLKAAKANGPSDTYRIQAHLYGRGWVRAGHDVSTVMVVYLPRNSVTLNDAYTWNQPYDESIAVAALNRADNLAKAVAAVGIGALSPNLERAPGCYSCTGYPNADGTYPPKPGRATRTSKAKTSTSVFG